MRPLRPCACCARCALGIGRRYIAGLIFLRENDVFAHWPFWRGGMQKTGLAFAPTLGPARLFMDSTVTIDLRHVARGLEISLRQIQAVVELLDEGNTVPFITRYRKDQTGGADEEQIREIQARLTKMRLLADRKQTILRSIEAQGKLTEKLAKQIQTATTTKRLEDLYLPYKPKKQTLATLARSRGLEELAQEILAASPACTDLDARARDFANPDRQVPSAADALLGAGHILAEQFSERADLRQRLTRDLSSAPASSLRPELAASRPAAVNRRAARPQRRWPRRRLVTPEAAAAAEQTSPSSHGPQPVSMEEAEVAPVVEQSNVHAVETELPAIEDAAAVAENAAVEEAGEDVAAAEATEANETETVEPAEVAEATARSKSLKPPSTPSRLPLNRRRLPTAALRRSHLRGSAPPRKGEHAPS